MNNIKVTTQRIKLDNVSNPIQNIEPKQPTQQTTQTDSINYNEIYKSQKSYTKLLVYIYNIGHFKHN